MMIESNGTEHLDSANDTGSDAIRPRILDLFDAAAKEGRPLYISAPMVRYSKLPFRLLAKHYKTDVTYIPMILSHEFIRSQAARDSDFTTNSLERSLPSSPSPSSPSSPTCLIAQFASSSPQEFARATRMIAPWVDGVDLNCGCPQSWAIKEGIGCSLMERPELVAEMVGEAKRALREMGKEGEGKSVSVKIRIHRDLEKTLSWISRVTSPGDVDYLTIHGRTRTQRSSTPPDYAAIARLSAQLRRTTKIPVVANGDAYSLSDVRRIAEMTGTQGVMAARGILENPAMFAGYDSTPAECVRLFLEYAVRCPVPFALVLHHVGEMTAKMEGMDKMTRKKLMGCEDLVDLIDFVEEKWGRWEGSD